MFNAKLACPDFKFVKPSKAKIIHQHNFGRVRRKVVLGKHISDIKHKISETEQ